MPKSQDHFRRAADERDYAEQLRREGNPRAASAAEDRAAEHRLLGRYYRRYLDSKNPRATTYSDEE